MLGQKPIRRLQLGPIVGHTDDRSTTIWIRVLDNPAFYTLRVLGVGSVPFVSTETENSTIEFGTATARIEGLRPDWQYRYQVLRQGRVIPGSLGTVRTMPSPNSMAEFQFVTVSCNHQEKLGAWEQLEDFINRSKPRFLLMIGDQVYVDQSGNIWKSHLDRPSSERRQALAQKYQDNWSRLPLRRIMANIPTYMMWDDHEIRDGWGSWAPDSPTLVEQYPRGSKIFSRHDAYFRDARDVYWHFQMSHNPSTPRPLPTKRQAMPFSIRCGRLLVLMLDSRGERDVWRKDSPVLGIEQWQWIESHIKNLEPEIDALAVVTTTPIATMSSTSLGQIVLGGAESDVALFRRGDAKGIENLINTDKKLKKKIDEVRDQWSHNFSRPEQEALIRKVGEARTANRLQSSPRGIIFLGGDIHLGGIFDITASKPSFKVPCLISSGISQVADTKVPVGLVVDESFEVAPGIKSNLRHVVQDYNFGVIQVVPTGSTPEILPAVVAADGSTVGVLQLGRQAI